MRTWCSPHGIATDYADRIEQALEGRGPYGYANAVDRVTHVCDDSCVCPVHGTLLLYWPVGDLHACQDAECEHAHGMKQADRRAGT
jgi:hypothetical protein